MTELAPGADRPPWRAGACARTPADEKVSLPRELERQKRALEQAYRDLARKVQTVEKRAKQLAKARAALHTACLKTRSLADLSHEIRTPMTAILGYVDLLGAPGTSEAERRKYLETIRRNGEHLLRVLDNVLELSKSGAGKMPLERKACSPVQLMGGESSADAAAEDATPPAVDRDFVLRGRILLAEDTPDIQRLIAFYLRKAGAEVTEAQDGLRACELATEAAASGTPFDVILMDMQMPKLDGYGATARLRASGYRGSIVALTAHSTKGDRWRCLAVGCDGFVSKPIDRRTLLETVQRHAARAVAPPPPCLGGGAAARGCEPPS